MTGEESPTGVNGSCSPIIKHKDGRLNLNYNAYRYEKKENKIPAPIMHRMITQIGMPLAVVCCSPEVPIWGIACGVLSAGATGIIVWHFGHFTASELIRLRQ